MKKKDYIEVAEKYSEYVNRMVCQLCEIDKAEEFGDAKDMYRHLLKKHKSKLGKDEIACGG